jgi:hypothetical protein
MKKGFLKTGMGVMLIASIFPASMAQITPAVTEAKTKKEKVQIVIVKKKDREKSGSDHKSRPDDHKWQ